jgi:hypothetical protein
MKAQLKASLALVLLASAPMYLKANPPSSTAEPLTAKEVRKAEAGAKTAADHLRLAIYYESRVKLTQSKLAEAEDLVNYWAKKDWMVSSAKVPNPYWSAKSRADSFRTELDEDTKLAANHRKAAESLQDNARLN